jgi:hypothetical protein
MSFGCVGISWMRSDDPLFLAMLASRLLQNVRKCGLKHGRLARRRSIGPWITSCRERRVQPCHERTAAAHNSVVMSRLPASPSATRLPTCLQHGSCSLVPVLSCGGAMLGVDGLDGCLHRRPIWRQQDVLEVLVGS